MSAETDKAAFEQKYVTTNVKLEAPTYSSDLIRELRKELCALDPVEFKYLSYAVLSALLIGAHRGDFVPKMFEEVIEEESDLESIKAVFYRIRECVMAIYAFVGIPWVVPSCLGIVNVLQRHGIEKIAEETFRGPIDGERLLAEGKQITEKVYRGVNNNEVRDMLSIGFPEMRKGIAVIVWGYNIGGAVNSGVLLDREVELLVATAIIGGGATRQSKSHIKASLGMGNRLDVVNKIIEIAMRFTSWNQTPVNPIDFDQLVEEMDSAKA
ncbi:hypothetical protein BKA61DRAFT_682505 [Leptodontidium sp. MPI-SDFR-AT-0119]|nr:hypothetical protein BKA61DRAFT_682505 [Leptodontidium sp. MPI-SDFR-AT-0119]